MRRAACFHSNAVWPPLALVLVFGGCYLLVAVCLGFIQQLAPFSKLDVSEFREISLIRNAVLVGAAAGHALYRLWRFHPACNRAYGAWLKLSPWTSRQPLPLGPVHLVWQDLMVLGIICVIAYGHAQVDPLLPLAIFGIVYLAGMSLLLAYTRTRGPALLLGFLWPALLLPQMRGWPMAVWFVALAGVVGYGHHRCLRAFPWHFPYDLPGGSGNSIMQFEITVPALSAGPASLKGARVGWPYLQLSPRFTCSSIPLLSCIWGSLLAGWWSFCIFVGGETPPLSEGIVLIACVAAVFRAALYCSGVAAPFNLLGRIALGRILIPGFDKVFLTPLAVAILAVLGGVIIRHAGSWFHLAESGVITVLVLVLFGGGPTLRGWILTGQHRFRPLAKTGSNARLLKPV